MPPQTSLSTYESLVTEYSTLTRSHDKSILAAAKARTAFIAADRDEIRCLKRTLASNTELINRSNIYRTHLKFVKYLARRLLCWNNDLRIRANNSDLDELDLLRYGTSCYQFMTAASQLAIMNQRGMQAKEKCEDRYDDVDRVRERKSKVQRRGQKAYEKQAYDTAKICEFFAKLSTFAGEIARAGKGQEGITDVHMRLNEWLDVIELRVKGEVERDDVEKDWEKVCKNDVVKDGVDASTAAEEEALYRGFDELMWNARKEHTWCPCCGAGHGNKKNHRR